MKRNNPRNSILHISRTQKIILFLVTFFCITGVFVSTKILKSFYSAREQERARVFGESIASGIKISLNQSLSISKFAEDLYTEYGDDFFENFEKLFYSLMKDNPIVGSIYFAPNGIIKHAYPPSVRDFTIGFDILKDNFQAEKAQLAIDTKKITVAGPHLLIEGGIGFVIRNPIFYGDKFQAFTIIVLNWDEFIEQSLQGISNNNSNFKFAVWKENDKNVIIDEFGFILNNSSTNVPKDVVVKVEVPNDTWYIAVAPKGDWISFSDLKFEISILIFSSLILISLVFLRILETARKVYRLEHDELTGLYTKNAFYSKVEKVLKENPTTSYDVLVADVENFRLINSIYGIKTGDEIIKYLADEYSKLPNIVCQARLGGDSFVSIYKTIENTDINIFYNYAKSIFDNAPIKNLAIKYGRYSEVDHNLPVSIICDRASRAAKSIKHNYGKIIENYDGPLSLQLLKVTTLETSFEEALKNEEFHVWFQPKIDAITENLVGAEALVRWIKPDGTIISPADFIPVFEDDGLIVRLDEYVFRKVCQIEKLWHDKGMQLVPISVNLSRISISQEGLVEHYSNIVKEIGVSAKFVPIELTESAAAHGKGLLFFTSNLKKAGFKIHMDDFGSGFSSLSSINILPFDVVKLDKSLIDFIGNPDGDELLRHTIELAQFKKMYVVAEGVENKEQLEFLKLLKCNAIQGYYYSAPMSYEKFLEFYESKKAQGKL